MPSRAQVSGGDTEAGPACGRKWPSALGPGAVSACPGARVRWTQGSAVGSGRGCDRRPVPQVFTLPKVSAKLKLKLTALEGSRVRRVSVAHFGSCRAEDYGEHHLAVLTNLGDIQVVSLPLLKPQVRYSCIRREDVSGIASCVFTKHGQGFYLISPSEFERFSLSTKWLVEPRCLVDSAETKHHDRPRNGSGPEKALGRARNSGSQSDGEEKRPDPVMEHALLNDERVLKEIQSTLEGDRGSYGDWRSQQVAMSQVSRPGAQAVR